jgi:ADP-heptose:LPS heptosyltransferase
LFSGAGYRLGWENGKGRLFYNLKAKRGVVRYSAAKKYDLLAPLGISEQDISMFYHIKEESLEYVDHWFSKNSLSDKQVICLSPGSPVYQKKWDGSLYAKLADLLIIKTGRPVVFIWAPNELDTVNDIMSLMKERAILAPPTSFNQGAAFLKKIALLICNDGGLNHLSCTTNTPTVAIFGKNPVNWSPEGYVKNHYHAYNSYNNTSDQSFGLSEVDVYNLIKERFSELFLI